MTSYPVTVSQNLTAHDASVTRVATSLADTAKVITPFPYPFAALGLTLTDGANLSLSAAEAMKWGRTIAETVNVSLAATPRMTYGVTLDQVLDIVAALRLAIPATLSQTISVSQTQNVALGLILLQKLGVLGKLSPEAVYHLALSQDFSVHDALGRFIGATIADALHVGPAEAVRYRAVTTLIQDFTLAQALTGTLHLSLVDDLALTDAELLRALFTDTLTDGVTVKVLYVSPSGFATTWAVNTRTNAVTEYQNYNFTGFAQMGLKYIACGPEGLYELDGPRDLTSAIIAEIETGFFQFNGQKLGGLKAIYLGMNAQGQFFVKIEDGYCREYVYQVTAQPGLATTKVNIGKGLNARYFSFDLTSTGPDFRLDTIEFVPMRRDRRV